jgi:hypothetical protein
MATIQRREDFVALIPKPNSSRSKSKTASAKRPPPLPAPKNEIQWWIIVPDIHASLSQEHDEKALGAAEEFMSSRKWDGYLNLGDLCDFGIISHHNKSNLRIVEKGRILEEYRVADSILSAHERIIRTNNPNARMIYLQANHEFRIEKYIDACPQLEGMLEVDKVLRLKDRKIEWIKSWSEGELVQLGNCFFHHGLYTNEHAAKKMVQAFNRNILFGHCHTFQVFTTHGYRADDVLIGGSLGCLCKIPQQYMRGSPSKWCHMITEFSFEPSSCDFWFNPIRIQNGKLCYDGEIFGR